MTRNPLRSIIALSLLAVLLAGCQKEDSLTPGPTDRNLAEAQWSLTDRDNREKQCGIYRAQGREGTAHFLKTQDKKFLDDFTELLERVCPPLA